MDIGLKFPKGTSKKKKRKSHPPSILGSQKGWCYLCGRCTNTQVHHIFGGPNRTLSEEYGLKVESEADEGTKVTIHIPAIPFNSENQSKMEEKSVERKGKNEKK